MCLPPPSPAKANYCLHRLILRSAPIFARKTLRESGKDRLSSSRLNSTVPSNQDSQQEDAEWVFCPKVVILRYSTQAECDARGLAPLRRIAGAPLVV